jgi:hypothetical protein
MIWSEIRKHHPEQWLVIEALEAHTTSDKRRHLDQLAVIATCVDGKDALARYQDLHKAHPEREFYFVHTGRDELEVHEKQWLGFRVGHAAQIEE